MSSCILTPTIKVGNQEKESKLFKELLSYTGSRESTKQLWCLSQIPEIRDNLNLEYDENGEPTFDSFNKAINIKDYLDGKIGIQGELKEVGAVDSKGETIEYKTSAEAYSKVIEFNNNNPRSVASVVKVPDGYVIQVKKLENSDLNEKKNIVFESRLNNKLLGLLKQLGFDIDVTNDPKYDGIFNPLNAQKNAEGLHTVIQIAKGTRGEEAFPEEFAHVVIAGMRNHPLVQRLLNNLTFDSIEDILGEDYEYYRDEYRADYNKLREEAAGKLLYKYIIKNNENVEHNNLLSRIWNWIKGIFGKAKESEVDNIILESEMEAYELANMVLDGSILPLIDKDLVLDSEPLFKIGKKTNVMKKLAEDALEIASRRLKIVRDRKKNGKYSKEDIKQIKGLQEYIEKKKYALSSIHFLEDSLDQIDGLYKNLKSLKEKYKESASPSLITIKHISSNLREIKTFSDGYSDIIKQMKLLPELLEEGEIDITEEEANKIAGIASQIDNILNVINRNYTSLRFDVVKNFLRIYWGDDKIKKSAGNKTEIITLDMILKMADKDINGLDRWVSSMSDASDPLLSLIDKVVKTSQANRDETINKVLAGIRNATKKLESAGYKSDFMYERDSQGNLTGRLISNIDFERFYKEKEEYMQNLKSQKLKSYQIRAKIEAWERKRMKKIKVVGSTIDRTEIVPIYETNNLSKLSTAQREYYDTMMRYKAMLDDLIPERYANLYNAVQIRNDALESITSNITDPKNAVHSLWGNLKDNFTRRLDDVDYGDLTDGLTEKQRNVVADFNGNPIEKLPVHYIHPLEDMQRLSTDFSGSITAYAGMAINYGEMSKVIDVLELARDLVHDREVKQEIGDSKVVETFKIMGKLFSKAYTKKGSSTNIGNRIDDYYATVIYGKTKKDHGSIRVLDKEVDIAKASDTIKGLTGAVGLGLNAFSAISNLTIGKMQMFIDSVSGSLTNLFGGQAEFFGVSNMAKAEFYYNALLPEYIIEAGSAQKKI